MQNPRILAVLLALTLLGVLLYFASASSPKAVEVNKAVEEVVKTGFSGAVLVQKGGQILVDRAFGKVEGLEMTTRTRFWISSTGKQFVSAAVMRGVENGLFDLDDPVINFFPGTPAEKQLITLRQLLSHTSGFGQSYVAEEAKNYREAADLILAEPLVSKPGEEFHYSNSNFQLLVAVLESVTGQDYFSFLREQFFLPLGLEQTGQTGLETGKQVAPTRFGTPERLLQPQWGGQGMFSTTHDLARWYRALVTGEIISGALVEEMLKPAAEISEGQAGLGWFLRTTKTGKKSIFVRGNDDFGPNSLIYGYPEEDLVIVVLTHAGDNDQGTSYSRAMLAALEQVLFPPQPSPSPN